MKERDDAKFALKIAYLMFVISISVNVITLVLVHHQSDILQQQILTQFQLDTHLEALFLQHLQGEDTDKLLQDTVELVSEMSDQKQRHTEQ